MKSTPYNTITPPPTTACNCPAPANDIITTTFSKGATQACNSRDIIAATTVIDSAESRASHS